MVTEARLSLTTEFTNQLTILSFYRALEVNCFEKLTDKGRGGLFRQHLQLVFHHNFSMKKPFSLISFWAFLSCVALTLLQMFPKTGIYLMMIGAPKITGFLIHVLLISLVIETLLGRIPKMLLSIPLLAYGSYYAFYFYQGYAISLREAQLQASNPGRLTIFDATKQALVMKRASGFVRGHKLPVVYEANTNVQEGHLAHRLMRKEECQTVPKDTQSRVHTFGVSYSGKLRQVFRKHGSGLCLLRFPEQPDQPIITVTATDEEIWKKRMTISEGHYTVTIDGTTLGTFTTASVFRISPIPYLHVGCGLVSSGPMWKCGATPKKTLLRLNTIPIKIDQERFAHPVSVMLGIEKYTTDELVNFTSVPSNLSALKMIQGEADRVQDRVFVLLDAMFVDKQMKPPHNMGFSLMKNHERLVKNAESIVTLFETLHGPRAREFAHSSLKREALSRAITVLPQPTFKQYAVRIFTIVKDKKRWNDYPALYVRAADVGETAFPFYKERFLHLLDKGAKNFLPVLAICRIGHADKELVDALKQAFQAMTNVNQGQLVESYHQALFLTLLQLDERDFAERHYRLEKLRHLKWYEEVLAKQSSPALNSNRCMIRQWPYGKFMGPGIAPSIKM